MGFLNSILLFGIAGTLVPLLIHLFQRRRALRMDFPSLRFLRELNQRQMRRLSLRRILLLVVRMLLVALVAFALARPTLKGGLAEAFPEDAPRSVALLVDRSGSMSLRTEAGTLQRRALERARELLDRMDSSDELRLYAMEERAFDLGGGLITPDMGRRLLDRWEAGEGPTGLRASLAEAMEALAERPHPLREIFLISDFAEGGLDSARLPDAGDLRVYALPVQASGTGNGALLGIQRPQRPVLAGRSFEMGLDAGGDAQEFSADLELNGQHRGSVGVDVGGNGRGRASLRLNLEGAGRIEGWWRKPHDRYEPDDVLPFVLSVEPRLQALLLAPPEPGDLSDLLGRAMDPYRGRGASRLAFDLRSLNVERLSAAELEGAHLVLLAGGAGLDGDRAEALAGYVKRGGGLLIFPDPPGAAMLARQLLPRLGGPRALESYGDEVLHLGEYDREHPIFAELGDAQLRVLRDQAFYRAYRCDPGPWAAPLRFEGGAPALLAWDLEAGRVRLALFDAATEGGELPWSSMFLPLVQEMAQEAAGAQQPVLLSVGDELIVAIASPSPFIIREWYPPEKAPLEERRIEGFVVLLEPVSPGDAVICPDLPGVLDQLIIRISAPSPFI